MMLTRLIALQKHMPPWQLCFGRVARKAKQVRPLALHSSNSWPKLGMHTVYGRRGPIHHGN